MTNDPIETIREALYDTCAGVESEPDPDVLAALEQVKAERDRYKAALREIREHDTDKAWAGDCFEAIQETANTALS